MEQLAIIEELEVKASEMRLELAIIEWEITRLKSNIRIETSAVMGWRVINNK